MGRDLRRSVSAGTAGVALLLGLVVGLAPSAGAAGAVTVRPGQSIQAAINAAGAGATIQVAPGTYHENLVITNDSVSLVGAGAGATVLEPPASSDSPCVDPESGGAVGICVLGGNLETQTVTRAVRGVKISGFTIRDFPAPGILVFGGSATTVQGNLFVGNGGYGVFANTSSGTQILNNTATGSDEAGIYVGDSPNASATVRGNDTFDNGIGIFLRSASRGVVSGNDSHDNCIGIMLLGEPNPSTNWFVSQNRVRHNDRPCPGSEDQPPVTGVGIGVINSNRNTVINNTVTDNAPGGETTFSGGIFLGLGSTANRIANNTALRNLPFDIGDFTGAANRFAGNRCATSEPPGLCSAAGSRFQR